MKRNDPEYLRRLRLLTGIHEASPIDPDYQEKLDHVREALANDALPNLITQMVNASKALPQTTDLERFSALLEGTRDCINQRLAIEQGLLDCAEYALSAFAHSFEQAAWQFLFLDSFDNACPEGHPLRGLAALLAAATTGNERAAQVMRHTWCLWLDEQVDKLTPDETDVVH